MGYVLTLLRLWCPFLLGSFVKCGGKLLQHTDQMDSQIPFGFVGRFNRLGHTFHGSGEMFKGGLYSFQACCDAAQKIQLTGMEILFGCAHGKKAED